MSVAELALFYLLLINCIAFILFYVDKRRAAQRKWRISEQTLLLTAFFGGSAGAKIAQQRLRHKSSKRPFALHLNLIILAQIVGAVVWFTPGLKEYLILLISDFTW